MSTFSTQLISLLPYPEIRIATDKTCLQKLGIASSIALVPYLVDNAKEEGF